MSERMYTFLDKFTNPQKILRGTKLNNAYLLHNKFRIQRSESLKVSQRGPS